MLREVRLGIIIVSIIISISIIIIIIIIIIYTLPRLPPTHWD